MTPEAVPEARLEDTEAGAHHNASSPEDTQDGSVAYARFPPRAVRYRDGLLPDAG